MDTGGSRLQNCLGIKEVSGRRDLLTEVEPIGVFIGFRRIRYRMHEDCKTNADRRGNEYEN